jgi:hypothetical protein
MSNVSYLLWGKRRLYYTNNVTVERSTYPTCAYIKGLTRNSLPKKIRSKFFTDNNNTITRSSSVVVVVVANVLLDHIVTQDVYHHSLYTNV